MTSQTKKHGVFQWGFIALALLIPSIVLNIFQYTRQYGQFHVGVPVVGVIDGDSLVLEGKSRIRLRHADAPELKFCGGKEAKKELESLVTGKRVRIDEQVADKYGRGMALVYVGDVLVNEKMLESGWARYHSDTSSKEYILKRTSQTAKAGRRGIYGICQSTDIPDKKGCIIKGNFDSNSDAKTYYTPDCAQYKFTVVEKDVGESWFCSEREALTAGFTKAKTCRGN